MSSNFKLVHNAILEQEKSEAEDSLKDSSPKSLDMSLYEHITEVITRTCISQKSKKHRA